MAEDPSTVGEMNGQATAGHNVQRDAWKSIRTHIHQYEQRLLELQFDYQQKVNAVEALKLGMRQLTQSTRDCEEKEYKMTQEAHNAFKDAMELDRQLLAAEKDRVMLTQQLVVEQQGLAEDAKKLEDTKAMFNQHLESQQDYINKLKHMIVAAVDDTATAAAEGSAPIHVDPTAADVAAKACGAADIMSDVACGQVDQGLAAQ